MRYKIYLQWFVVCITGILFFVYPAMDSLAQDALLPPNAQDCLGALPVCQPVYSTTNSYTGCGNVCPEIHNNSNCPLCMDGETNDVFYIITVQTSGVLRFTLTPNNPNNDYDWSVFNMTNSDCSQLYPQATSLQVSCNSYGAAGYNGPTGINSLLGNLSNCNGPGTALGPPFNKDLTVSAGQTYLINISNWSSTSQSGYTLDFSGSTADIFDDVPPVIDSIQQSCICSGTSQLFFRFSENVMCADVFQHAEKLTLTGPDGPVLITDITSADCATGANQSPIYHLSLGSVITAGSYTLSIVGDIRDLCSNVALYESYPFDLTGINAPVAGAGNDTTVNNGAIINLNGSSSGGTSPLSYHWEPANLLVNPNVQDPTTVNMGATTEFVLTVTDNLGCADQDEVVVSVIGGPLGVSATAIPGTICNGVSVQLTATGTGGSGNYSYSWTSNPSGFTSNLPNPVVFPTTNTTYSVTIADGFSTFSASTSVTVHPLPVAQAGPDVSIPYGTYTTLNGSASGGSGNYNWLWNSNPPGFSSTLQNPVTNNLEVTTIFSLRATDQTTGCMSSPDDVLVSVTGSPLSVSPIALPPVICQGVTTQLMAMTSGGTGSYTYSWTSAPAGFTSSDATPEVSPMETTSYFVTVSDGFNQASGNVNVIVNPIPQIYLGPSDTMVCIYDTVTLDAGNPGANYYWSNGATTRTIQVSSPGIGYDLQTYTVKVINEYACVDSAEINVIFTFAACTGIYDEMMGMDIRMFPNPTTGLLTLSLNGIREEIRITITNLYGQTMLEEELRPSGDMELTRQFDLSGWARGLYLVQITGAWKSEIRKILVE
ncbi:MAG: T9SS type A sorting domain-containing protein [Bacteroidales bacterium]|nr:T9SS type A sorting domain-containing protein [Bacteroidales bacterium]